MLRQHALRRLVRQWQSVMCDVHAQLCGLQLTRRMPCWRCGGPLAIGSHCRQSVLCRLYRTKPGGSNMCELYATAGNVCELYSGEGGYPQVWTTMKEQYSLLGYFDPLKQGA